MAKQSKKNKMVNKKNYSNKKKSKINKTFIKKTVLPIKKTIEEEKNLDKGLKGIALLRGMKDLLPQKSHIWIDTWKKAEAISSAYGFKFIETPILESASLFVKSLGKTTDVVDKEMYVFEDKDGSKVCLRPEGTAAVSRAYINHGLHTLPQPVNVWYWGSMFRHDRPQAGRYREFHQFSCESLGERSPVVDAQLIVIAYNYFRDLGIETTVQINSIGNLEDRKNYIVELTGYLKSKRNFLSEESKKRIAKNPMRILDSKDEQDKIVVEEAPQIVDWLSDESKKFFMSVLEYLDEAKVPYVLKSTLVRGLDYYTDTVFEFYEDGVEEGSQSALGGGGRYDGLVEFLGGQPTPAAGFSIGVERVNNVLIRKEDEARKLEHQSNVGFIKKNKGIFFAQLGEQARKRALYLIEDLRRGGIVINHNLAKSSLKAQMELANKIGVTHTLILGQKETQEGTILVRDMESGIQEIVDQKKLKQKLIKLNEKNII